MATLVFFPTSWMNPEETEDGERSQPRWDMVGKQCPEDSSTWELRCEKLFEGQSMWKQLEGLNKAAYPEACRKGEKRSDPQMIR